MDLDQDGNLDILSGSYSRMEGEMAGLFQVLWGRKEGTFARAKPLLSEDAKPLVLPGDEGDRICTRPFAGDLDGDGHLDLVVGSMGPSFSFFAGKGKGRFDPRARRLEGSNLWVDSHSDPFLVDWDGDGDLDLLSGSAAGGVFLFPNEGSKTSARFGRRVTLVKQPRDLVPQGQPDVLGDAHLRGPGMATRVWADDTNGDGKLDLFVGDCVTLYHAAEGVSAATALEKLAAWKKAVAEIPDGDGWSEQYSRLTAERDAFVTDESVGFVWLVRRK